MKNRIRDYDEIIRGLRTATMLPGSWDKRFSEQMYFSKQDYVLTESQIEWIFRLLYKYRAQLPELYEKHKDNEFCKPKK